MRMEITVTVALVPDSEPAKAADEAAKPAPPASAPPKPAPFPSRRTLNMTDVTTLTGLSRGEIQSAVALGKLAKPSRRGRGFFFDEDAVRAFILARRAEAGRNTQ